MISSRAFSFLITLSLIAGLLIPLPAAGQMTIYVDDDANGAADGSQSDPYAALQEAFSDASNTSGAAEIRVAEGVYYPDEGSNVTDGDSSATFRLSGDLTVKGGYTSDFSSRDPAANVTVLSGDIDQDDTTNNNGVVTDTSNISGMNSTHVVRANELSASATLDGLTVTAGQANDESLEVDNGLAGGGAVLLSSDVVCTNVEFVGNNAVERGGAMYMNDTFDADPGSLAVKNSTLRANAGQFGGAVKIDAGPFTLTGTTVRNNVAGDGGGIHVSKSDKFPRITDVTFIGNRAINDAANRSTDGQGGGLYVSLGFSSSPEKNLLLRSVTFENNATEEVNFSDPGKGGGAYLQVDSPRLIDVTFRDNTVSETDAGGLYVNARSGLLRNGLFVNNAASIPDGSASDASAGAAVLNGLTVENTTFRNNSANTDGGAVVARGSTFEGVLFEGNSAAVGIGGGLNASGSYTIRDATFRENIADRGGGLGTSDVSFSPTGRLENVNFVSNESAFAGGGMFVTVGEHSLKNVDFVENVSDGFSGGKGGAIQNTEATVRLGNAEVRGNEGVNGIIEVDTEGTYHLTNVLVADNSTSSAGAAAVRNVGSTTNLDNVVVAANGAGLANRSGRGNSNISGTMTVQNSIVTDGINNRDGNTLDVQNTLVEGGLPSDVRDNGGNLSGDPMFADPSNGDYHLQSGSPAVDAGDDSLIPDDSLDLDADGDSSETVPYDLDRRARTNNTVDLGPYERGGSSPQFTASLSSGASDAGLPDRFGADLTFQTLSTSTDLTVTYDASASTEGLGLPGTQSLAVTSLWDVELDPEPSSSDIDATLCFDIQNLSFPVVDRSALNVYARSGPSATDWQERTSTELRPSADNPEQICATGQSSFSQFAVTAKESELPVELVAFEARVQDEAVRLSWQTASETNNAGFEIQHRAKKTASWDEVGFVEGAGTTTEAQRYRYSVDTELAPGTHRFRLRQVDTDGTAHLSEPVTVQLQMDQPVRLTAPAPNPVQDRATLSFAVKKSVETTLRLYNILGQRVATLYRGTPASGESTTVGLSAADLPSGTYFLRLEAGTRTLTQRLTVVR